MSEKRRKLALVTLGREWPATMAEQELRELLRELMMEAFEDGIREAFGLKPLRADLYWRETVLSLCEMIAARLDDQ